MKKKVLLFAASGLLLASCDSLFSANSSQGGNSNNTSFSFVSDLDEKEELYPLSHDGVTYYFSSSGDDSNNGLSPDTPMKSLTKASRLTLKEGDQILFKKGDTFKGHLNLLNLQGKSNNPITIASYGDGNDKPILRNNSKDDMNNVVMITKASNVVFRDIRVDVYARSRHAANAGNCINGIEFNYPYMGDTKCKNLYIINNEVYGDSQDCNAMGITISSSEDTISSSPHKVLTNLYVCYNHVENVGRSAIHSGGWLYGASSNGNEGTRDKYYNVHFDHNYVKNAGCMGIYPMDSTNGTCNYNYVNGTGMFDSDPSNPMEGECGIMALCNENLDIMFNEILNCKDQGTGYDAMGIDIDWNTNNIDVAYNYCHNNEGAGVGTMANQNCFIRNNRLVDNEGVTNHPGSICISNFTSRYEAVPDDWHSVKNCTIDSNYIYHTNENQPVFSVVASNGDTDFVGNSFTSNHTIYTKSTSYYYWIKAELPWQKYEKNKYYANDIDDFRAIDITPMEQVPSNSTYSEFYNKWSLWNKRDVNSTYEVIPNSLSYASLSGFNCDYNGLDLTFNFTKGSGDYWHANVYKVNSLDEELSVFNMIGESDMYGTTFTYTPTIKERCYYVFQVEGNDGGYGQTYPIEVTLR